jgi:HK97 family phage prohead protease
MSETFAATERFFLVAPIEKMEVQNATGNNTWTMSGYAAVFNQTATLYDSGFERMTVEIHPNAFDRVLAEQDLMGPSGVVHFNHGHDMKTAVAATDVPVGQPGSLELTRDSHGFRFFARVSKDDPDAVALAAKMRTGVVKQASFAFTSTGDQFTEAENMDGPPYEVHRRIMEMGHIYDVCAATQGVFHQTVAELQAYSKLLGPPDSGGHRRRTDLVGDTDPAPVTGGVGDTTPNAWSLSLESILARADHLKRFGGSEGTSDVRTGHELDEHV